MSDQLRVLEELLGALTGRLVRPDSWTPLLQLASDTLTIGSLACVVLGSPLEPELRPEVRAVLTDVLARATERNERLLGQFLEILPDLNAAGIEPLVMRGLTSVLHDGAACGRLMADVDLLIPRESRELARQLFIERGYEIHRGFHGAPFSITLGRDQDVGMVDLHTDVQPFSLDVNYHRLTPLCKRLRLKQGTVLVPDATCSLLLYILHDQLHDGDYYRGLIDARHLVEIPRLLDADIDWEALYNFLPPGVARAALHVQLRTARDLLGVAVPPEQCGGMWARIQVIRRRTQLRHRGLMTPFTLLTMVLDPPRRLGARRTQRSSGSRTLWQRSTRSLGAPNPGKVVFRSR